MHEYWGQRVYRPTFILKIILSKRRYSAFFLLHQIRDALCMCTQLMLRAGKIVVREWIYITTCATFSVNQEIINIYG